MSAALKAGFVYFGVVFSVGFVLGTIRVLQLLPRLGEIASVVLEAPAILAVSWIASRSSIKKFHVSNEVLPRLLVGAVAFVLLMLTELVVSVLVFSRTIEDHFASYCTPQGAIGLTAQIAFALFPLAQRTRK